MRARHRVVVATASYGGGHHEIAEALTEALRSRRPGAAAVLGIDLLERCAPRSARLARVAYGAGEDFFPDGAGDLSALARSRADDPLVRELLGGGMASAEAALAALEPHAILAIHPVAGGIAAELRARLGCVVATVFPSLGEEAGTWVHPSCDLWFAPTAEVRDALVRRGADWSSVVVSGTPVREIGGSARSAMGLEDRFTAAVLDTGRTDGRAVVGELSSRGVQVVTSITTPEGRARRPGRPATVVARGTRLQELLAVADVLVTGPCGAAQWVAPACGTPMVVLAPVPALEAASVRVLALSGAALVAADVPEAAEVAAYLMRHPERVASMSADAARLARPAAARAAAERLLAELA